MVNFLFNSNSKVLQNYHDDSKEYYAKTFSLSNKKNDHASNFQFSYTHSL